MPHETRITKAGATHPITPQSVVLLDPATGNPQTAMPVAASARTVVGTSVTALVSSASAVTLASLCVGGVIPPGAVAVELQAQGGTLRIRRDGSAPTVSNGVVLYDGLFLSIDSSLSAVQLLALAGSTYVNATFYDRV